MTGDHVRRTELGQKRRALPAIQLTAAQWKWKQKSVLSQVISKECTNPTSKTLVQGYNGFPFFVVEKFEDKIAILNGCTTVVLYGMDRLDVMDGMDNDFF